MKLGFKRGEKGFTLIEIIIVLAVLGILAAIVIPNVSGFIGTSKERGWQADKNVLQAAVDSWRTDFTQRGSGDKWPVADNKTVGKPTVTGAAITAEKGMIYIDLLATDNYISGKDAVKSANTAYMTTANNTPTGSYVWYIHTNGTIRSIYYDGSAWQDDFVSGVYP